MRQRRQIERKKSWCEVGRRSPQGHENARKQVGRIKGVAAYSKEARAMEGAKKLDKGGSGVQLGLWPKRWGGRVGWPRDGPNREGRGRCASNA